MRLARFSLLLSLVFFFYLVSAVQGKVAEASKVTLSPGGSAAVGRAVCDKQRVECKEGNGGSEASVLESEDYIYTQSLP